jgi:hypothetical protein
MPSIYLSLFGKFLEKTLLGLLIGGRERGREGLVYTACICAINIQILNNPT